MSATATLPLPTLMRRYAQPGPRYTSYPSVPFWSGDFGESEYVAALGDLRHAATDPLSLYVHLPFCATRCHYCGCNALVNRREGAVDRYLDHVEREVALVTECIGSVRRVTQLHWGGGTPNFLDGVQAERLMRILGAAFAVAEGAEISIEIDPRIATAEQVAHLRGLGFNRISMGVQDFDPEVQRAIGRVQPEEVTVTVFEACREAGFGSVNLDLVYGLPHQTPESFARTVERVVELGPDRVSTFSYAHLPHLRSNQRAIDATALPDSDARFAIFRHTVDRFRDRGYDWIGIDHFARRDDLLAVAARERRLLRNFMGYTTDMAPHTLAFGASGIGYVADRFVQNTVELPDFYARVGAGTLPAVRGMQLGRDDLLRQRVIQHLMCNLEIPFALTVDDFGERVDEALGPELRRMAAFAADGLIDFAPGVLRVTEAGRYFVRNIAMVLDRYLGHSEVRPAFSSTV
jgi:oxygen-independent coproporphyrinogen III oxidase